MKSNYYSTKGLIISRSCRLLKYLHIHSTKIMKIPAAKPSKRRIKHPCMSSRLTVWLSTSATESCFEHRSFGGKYSFIQRSIRPIWWRRVISVLNSFRYGEFNGITSAICSSMNSSSDNVKSHVSVIKNSRLMIYFKFERQSMWTCFPFLTASIISLFSSA